MSPHVRYDILLANLYFKNIHQSEDFQEERRPRHELGSVVVGRRWGVVGGRRGRKGGVGKPIHLSLQALAGATAAALQRRKRRRRRRRGICCSSTSEREDEECKREKVGWCCKAVPLRGSQGSKQLGIAAPASLLPPHRRRSAATDKSAAAGSKFNTFPVSPCLPCCRGSNANLGRTQ